MGREPLETQLVGREGIRLGVECPQSPKYRKEEGRRPACCHMLGALLSRSHVLVHLISARTLGGQVFFFFFSFCFIFVFYLFLFIFFFNMHILNNGQVFLTALTYDFLDLWGN